MIDPIAIVALAVAGFSTAISAVTFWFVFLHRGRICMTQPTMVFFGCDGDSEGPMKVFLRSSIYSTSKRGHIVENLYAVAQTASGSQLFPFWDHRTDESSRIVRGSGLHITERGVACDHHFLLPNGETEFEFVPGDCTITVLARLVGQSKPVELGAYKIALTEEQCLLLRDRDVGIYFDLEPSVDGRAEYHAHVESRPSSTAKNMMLPRVSAVHLPTSFR